MTVECCNTGANSSLAIGGVRMDFIEFIPMRCVKMLSDGSKRSIRGRLARNSLSVGESLLFIEFRISMYMTAVKNSTILPIMGLANTSGNTYTLGDSLPDCEIILGPKSSKEQRFDGAVCAAWSISGQKGTDPVRLDLVFRAKTDVEDPVNTFFASVNSPATVEGYPYSFTNGSMVAYGSTRFFNQFRLAMNFDLIDEFNNSVTATNFCPTDHDLTLSSSVLYSTCDSNDDLWTTPLSGSIVGSAGTLNFDRSDVSKSTHFSLGNIKQIARFPRVIKNDFLRLPLNFEVFAVGTASELICTNSA